jgi:hypothetical protein
MLDEIIQISDEAQGIIQMDDLTIIIEVEVVVEVWDFKY